MFVRNVNKRNWEEVNLEKKLYLFSIIITVMCLYIFIGTLKPFINSTIGECFSNRTSVTYLFIASMVEFDGARNSVWELAKILTHTFSMVIISFDSETNEFLFNCLICAEVGKSFVNDAKKQR